MLFTESEIKIITKGLDHSKGKNDELTMMLEGMKDPEVEEINATIASVKSKFKNGTYDSDAFTQRELSEMKTGVMGIFVYDIGNDEIGNTLGKLNSVIEE